MFGRNANAGPTLPLALVLATLFFYGPSAAARTHHFGTGSPFGIGFAAGAEELPHNTFAAGIPQSNSSWSHYFLFMPQLDFINVVVQAYFGWHFYPTISGSGTDSRGNFQDSSQSGNMSYGGRVLLAPWISPKLGARSYLALGLGMASAKLKNTRTYKNASGTVTAGPYTESVSGSGLELQAGLGVEFFALQNYSFRLEGGYAQRNINGFKHSGTNDVTGTTTSDGDEALDQNGRKKAFNLWSPYAQIGFTLNL